METNLWTQVEPQIKANIEALAARNRAVRPMIFLIGTVVSVLLLTLVMRIFHSFPPFMLFGVLVSVGIGFGIPYAYFRHKHSQQYKTEVVPVLLKTICPGATYHPKGILDREVIKASHLHNAGWGERYKNEDTIVGKVDKTDFIYGEVTLSHMQSNGKSTYEVIDFKGFVFEADFNKYFNGLTIVTSKHVTLTGDATGLFSRLKRCRLEDVTFEERYKTYTSDDQEARYILSPALQQRILEMNDTFRTQLGDSELSISFHDSRMMIMVPSHTDRFEVKYDLEGVKKDFLALTVMIDIVNQLNLNLRIWTKE